MALLGWVPNISLEQNISQRFESRYSFVKIVDNIVKTIHKEKFQYIIMEKMDTDLNIKSILIIGFFQVLALIPGVSRAGITITAGRILGFNRTASTKISRCNKKITKSKKK